MTPENQRRIARIAARQWGIVSRAELLSAGISDTVIRRALAEETLRRLYPGVYLAGIGDLHPHGRLLAALKTVDPLGAVTHASAADLADLIEYDGPPHITSAIRSTHAIDGIHIHRTRSLPRVIVRQGLRTTTIERTIADLATTGDEPTLQRALNQACFKSVVNLDRLAAFAHNRKGATKLRRALADAAPAQSPLEDRFYALIRAARLPPPLANRFVGPYRVDFLWREHQLIVETDGWAGHGHGFARLNDARRDAYLRGLGLTTHRLRGATLEHHPFAAIAELAVRLDAP